MEPYHLQKGASPANNNAQNISLSLCFFIPGGLEATKFTLTFLPTFLPTFCRKDSCSFFPWWTGSNQVHFVCFHQLHRPESHQQSHCPFSSFNVCKEICVSKTGLSNHLNIVHKLSKEQIKSSLHISIEIVEIEDDEEQEIQIITIDVDQIPGIHEDKDQEMATDVSQSSIRPSEQELSGLPFGRAPGPPDPKINMKK